MPGNCKSHLASKRDQSRGTTGGWASTIQLAICDAQQSPSHWHAQADTIDEPQPIVAEYIS